MRRPKNEPYIYVRPDGVIEVRWTNPQTGRRVTRIARDRAHVRHLLTSITVPSPPRPARAPTLAEWVDHWLAMRVADGLDPDTAATYERQLRRVVVPLRTHPLTAITPVLLAGAWFRLATTPTPAGLPGYAPSTIRTTRHLLKLCLDDAVTLGIVAENPVRGRAVRSESRHLDVSAARAAAILRAVQGTIAEGPVTLGLCYGLRLGEQLGLRWGDINFDAGVITIQGQQTVTGYKGRTKTGARRELPIIPPVARVIGKNTNGHSPFVFAGRSGKPISRSGVRYAFDTSLARSGLERCRLHDLRHMTATLLARLGVDIAVRQEIVGHASVQVHGLYRHVSWEDKKNALEHLSRALGSGWIEGAGGKPTPF